MDKEVRTTKMIRQRKFLVVLPLLVLPFMTMIFWALGGGKIEKVEAQKKVKSGFNINLPDAKLKDMIPMDKMSYYVQAQQDSAKFRELLKNDPNYKNMNWTDTGVSLSGQSDDFEFPTDPHSSLYGNQRHNDPNTDKIYRKLAELNREMNNPVPMPMEDKDDIYLHRVARDNNTIITSSEVDRLEQMMNRVNQPAGEDPELKQLNGMLDKIMDIQYPVRVQERLKQPSKANGGEVLTVSPRGKDNSISILINESVSDSASNGFYSLTNLKDIANSQNAIKAVIQETQTIVDGSTVKLRLVNDLLVNGVHIPKDNFLYGTASLRGERLNIRINSIRYHNSLFPVELSVYDMDGLNGIYIPNAITRDVAKQSADRSMQTIGLASLDPSWEARAAGAGIEAAKTLFGRKIKLIKVIVKAGYQVFLRDEKRKEPD